MRNVLALLFVLAFGNSLVLGGKGEGHGEPFVSPTTHEESANDPETDSFSKSNSSSRTSSPGSRLAKGEDVFLDGDDDSPTAVPSKENPVVGVIDTEDAAREKSVSTIKDELSTKEKLECEGQLSLLAWEMAQAPIDDDLSILTSLAEKVREFYKISVVGKGESFENFVKQDPNFKYCCGLVLYYLQDTDTAFWVKEIFPEEMTQKSGIILIKNAPGPWSHFFLQSIGVCDDEENL